MRAWRAFRLVTAYSAPRQDERAGHGGRSARTLAFPGLISLNSVGTRATTYILVGSERATPYILVRWVAALNAVAACEGQGEG